MRWAAPRPASIAQALADTADDRVTGYHWTSDDRPARPPGTGLGSGAVGAERRYRGLTGLLLALVLGCLLSMIASAVGPTWLRPS